MGAPWKRRFLLETIIFRGEMLVSGRVIVGLGPGGLDSWNPLIHERDWDSWVYPDSNPKPPGPKTTINHYPWTPKP